MKKIVFWSIVAISTSFSTFSWGQEFAGGLLGGQGGGANNGGQPTTQGGGLRGVIRDQIQNAIQPNLPGGQNSASNAQVQGGAQLNGQVGGLPIQNGAQPGANPQQIFNNQPGNATSLGSQLLGVLRNNLTDHADVGQDGTVRFRNNVNPQMRSMGILPNDQLIDSNGQVIRDLNTANSFLQANQNLRVRRNGQIITIHQSTSPSHSNTSQLGWSFGTRDNGVFISSLVSNSIAAQAGLRAGDQIVSINGNPVG
ncbi:MAG TPA: PDZ domain-containing protein, partial [Pirellula sp.]|nr:PDZ domain-containing protein [Pirellula sp.]